MSIKERRTTVINITNICNFLSINAEEISDVRTTDVEGTNYITITLKKKEEICPYCKNEKVQLKEYRLRKIKHALFIGKETIFILKVRRYKCLSCNKTFAEKNNYAPNGSKISFATIRNILNDFKSYNMTLKDIASKNHVSDTTVGNIFDKYVNIRRLPLPRMLSIDECYNKNQFNKPYSAILFDFEHSKLVDVIEDRSKFRLSKYFSILSKDELNKVEFVISDMWEPYLDTQRYFFPHAIFIIDSFHVIKEIRDAVDKVRRRIMRGYPKESQEYYLLKNYNEVLFQEQNDYEEKIKLKRFDNKWFNRKEIQKIIMSIHPDLDKAASYFLHYKFVNAHYDIESFRKDYDAVTTYNHIIEVPEFMDIIRMFQNWKEYIINSFLIVNGRRLSNGPIEGFNSNFKKLMRVSNGLESFPRFRSRLIYAYNKIDVIYLRKEKMTKPRRKKRGKYRKKKS